MRRICESPELNSLDTQHQAYMDEMHRVNPKATLQIARLNKEHRKWLDQCIDNACIQEWFVVELQAMKQGTWGNPGLHGSLEPQSKAPPPLFEPSTETQIAEKNESSSQPARLENNNAPPDAKHGASETSLEKTKALNSTKATPEPTSALPKTSSAPVAESENFVVAGFAWIWNWIKTLVGWSFVLLIGWFSYSFLKRVESSPTKTTGQTTSSYRSGGSYSKREATKNSGSNVTSHKADLERPKPKPPAGPVGYTVFGVTIRTEPLPYKGSFNDFNYLCENGKPLVRGTSYGSVTGYQTNGKLQVFFKPGRDPSKYRFDAAGGVEIHKMR